MIDRTHVLPVSQQARLVGIAKRVLTSAAGERGRPVADAPNDDLYMEFPFAGAPMLARQLCREGREIDRRRVRTLMNRMGIEALY